MTHDAHQILSDDPYSDLDRCFDAEDINNDPSEMEKGGYDSIRFLNS